MFKILAANIAVLFLFPFGAMAADSMCSGYNEYVTKQCASLKTLKGDLSGEMLKGYSVKGCRNDSFKMILESDVVANASCKPVISDKFIISFLE